MVSRSLRLTLTQGTYWLCPAKFSWERRCFLSHSRANETAPLVLQSSQFAHLFEEGPTEAIYRGTPLYGMGQYQQGQLAQDWARRVLQEQHPESQILDPDPGTDCNGNSRALSNAPFDFQMDGRRVEVKSARLASNAGMRWRLEFWNVKLPFGTRHETEFEDLYLVALSPHGLSLVKHDLFTGVSTCGRRTEVKGHRIQVSSPRGEADWEEALHRMMQTLCEVGNCELIANETFSRPEFQPMSWTGRSTRSKADALYLQCPMRNMSKEKRGLRIQAMGQQVNQVLNPRSSITCLTELVSENGLKKGDARADWVRDGKRIELKSSGLTWHPSQKGWRCEFHGIKPNLFDELWLAIRSPHGVHFYKATSLETLGPGVGTEYGGLRKAFYGPIPEEDPLKAFQVIEAKMLSKGCEPLAVVQWDHTGSRR